MGPYLLISDFDLRYRDRNQAIGIRFRTPFQMYLRSKSDGGYQISNSISDSEIKTVGSSLRDGCQSHEIGFETAHELVSGNFKGFAWEND
jgi:hypothetical protein